MAWTSASASGSTAVPGPSRVQNGTAGAAFALLAAVLALAARGRGPA